MSLAFGAARVPTRPRHGGPRGRSNGSPSERPTMKSVRDEDFVSGASGTRGGIRATFFAAADLAITVARELRGIDRALDRLADAIPRRRILIAAIYRPTSLLEEQVRTLRSERHAVELALGSTAGAHMSLADVTTRERLAGGKFENLNAVL